MNKKWILYVGGFDMPDNNAAAQRVLGNAKAFQDLGYNTFFVGLSKKKEFCNTIKKFEGFNFINHHYPNNYVDWLIYLLTIKGYKKYLKRQPDIIIAYNFPAFALNKLRKCGRKMNIPIIADCTEWYEAKGSLFFRLIKGFDTWYRMKKVHLKMDGIIVISNYLYDYYSTFMSNVFNIPPLVDLSMDKWKNILSDDFYTGNTVNIVFAGTYLNGKKDIIHVILDALSLIDEENIMNFKFTIIGVTFEQYIKRTISRIPENIKDKLIFKGRLSHLETIKEIKKSHFNIFIRENNLTNRAGFPTKFSESISCGTPVITNSNSGLNDYIIEGKNGFLIESLNLDELNETLKKAINLPKYKIKEMKDFCYQSQVFDYRNYLNKFKKVLVNFKSYDL